MHSTQTKNGMTIELSGKRPRRPEEFTGDAIYPFRCLSDLGVLYIHSKEKFSPIEVAFAFHNTAYSIVLTPKITTGDVSLRDFQPRE